MEMKTSDEPDPRIYFAAERTFLAWLRTGLALMGFGFVVARFGVLLSPGAPAADLVIGPTVSSRGLGITLTLVGVVLTGMAFANHVATVRRLNRGEPFVGRPTWLGGAVAALLMLVGLLIVVFLLSP